MDAKMEQLILVTGPTGSGKSTTLAAMIEHVNKNSDRHIITIEDPIEYKYQCKKSLIHQREVGEDVGSFADALRSALREDPDVILVGEMRDYETILPPFLRLRPVIWCCPLCIPQGRHRQWNVLLMPARPAVRIRSESSWPLL